MKTLEKKLKETNKIFIPYIMAGDHEKGLDGLQETISLLENAGASAIEIGIPFSDPVADGPVIEQAGLRALAKGVSLKQILSVLTGIDSGIPLIVMSYFNPIYQIGLENFVAALAQTPVAGLIIPDLPKELDRMVKPYLDGTDIALIPLVSLTTRIERQKFLVDQAEGFVYAVAVNGVTGKANAYRSNLDAHLTSLSALTDLPVVTGFGVSSLADVERFNQFSNGVIVGTKIVRDLYAGRKEEVVSFIQASVE